MDASATVPTEPVLIPYVRGAMTEGSEAVAEIVSDATVPILDIERNEDETVLAVVVVTHAHAAEHLVWIGSADPFREVLADLRAAEVHTDQDDLLGVEVGATDHPHSPHRRVARVTSLAHDPDHVRDQYVHLEVDEVGLSEARAKAQPDDTALDHPPSHEAEVRADLGEKRECRVLHQRHLLARVLRTLPRVTRRTRSRPRRERRGACTLSKGSAPAVVHAITATTLTLSPIRRRSVWKGSRRSEQMPLRKLSLPHLTRQAWLPPSEYLDTELCLLSDSSLSRIL